MRSASKQNRGVGGRGPGKWNSNDILKIAPCKLIYLVDLLIRLKMNSVDLFFEILHENAPVIVDGQLLNPTGLVEELSAFTVASTQSNSFEFTFTLCLTNCYLCDKRRTEGT